MPSSKPMEFVKLANEDPETNDMVLAALEKGAEVTAAEVIKIAKLRGYKFTRKEFEAAVRKSHVERFAAGDYRMAAFVAKPQPHRAPKSACSRGCLSFTIDYHPRPF